MQARSALFSSGGASRFAGGHVKRKLTIYYVHPHLVARAKASTENFLGQRILQLGLDGTLFSLEFEHWQAQGSHYTPLIERVIEQTRRRVFAGENVSAREKILSLFEEHTDLIVKGSRDIQFGHKLNLTSGRSGLILDVVIEDGNPADAERFLPVVNRHIELYGYPPRQVAADGGYASTSNVQAAKSKGMKNVDFHKKRGLSNEAMVKSPSFLKYLARSLIEREKSNLRRRQTQRTILANSPFIQTAVRSIPSRIDVDGDQCSSTPAKSLLNTLTGTSNGRDGR